MMSDELPFVPLDVVDYLKNIYTMSSMISKKDVDNNDEHIGYIKGVNEVIDILDGLATRKE